MNLSSLIDLPPSAFNSSFPPPVVREDLFDQYHHEYFIKRSKPMLPSVRIENDS
jgi:hypothetical protein